MQNTQKLLTSSTMTKDIDPNFDLIMDDDLALNQYPSLLSKSQQELP